MKVSDCSIEHIPVLTNKLAELVSLPQDAVMVDATIGQGGHSLLFGQDLGPAGVIVGLDVDVKAIQRAHFRLKELACGVILVHSNFSRIKEVLDEEGIKSVDFVLADLGVSSSQLADTETGLSFLQDMPLDMRIDKRLKRTAADIINRTDEKTLADLIYEFGEERGSRRIARYIVRHRRGQSIATTGQLAAIVCKALGRMRGGKRSRIHPATRTFQALRIAVNDELGNLKRLLFSAPGVLKKDGLIAIISFHSLEDRIVKNDFKKNKEKGVYRIITKKPVVASKEEKQKNRRARSAKLRIAQKVSEE